MKLYERAEKHSLIHPCHYTYRYIDILFYTLSALTLLPMTIATHSPGEIEWPDEWVIPAICGLQHRLLISAGAEYAYTGSESIFAFFDVLEDPDVLLGDAPPARGEFGPRL